MLSLKHYLILIDIFSFVMQASLGLYPSRYEIPVDVSDGDTNKGKYYLPLFYLVVSYFYLLATFFLLS